MENIASWHWDLIEPPIFMTLGSGQECSGSA
jgi:hypothetical protein